METARRELECLLNAHRICRGRESKNRKKNNKGENEVLAQYRRRHVWDDVLLRGFWFLFCFFLFIVDSKSRAAEWLKQEGIPRPIEHETTVHYYYYAQQLPESDQNPRR